MSTENPPSQLEANTASSPEASFGRTLVNMSSPGDANANQFANGASQNDIPSFSERGYMGFNSPYHQLGAADEHGRESEGGHGHGHGHGHCGGGHDRGQSGNAAPESGNAGQESGIAGQESGNAGQESGNAGQESGNAGQESGNAGQVSGNAGQGSQEGSMNSAQGADAGQTTQQLEQSVVAIMQIIETDLTQIQTELSFLTGQSGGSSAPSDSGAASNSSAPSDSGAASNSSAPSDSGSASNSSAPSDSGAASNSSAPSDSGAASNSSAPSDSGTVSSSASTTTSDTTSPSDTTSTSTSTSTSDNASSANTQNDSTTTAGGAGTNGQSGDQTGATNDQTGATNDQTGATNDQTGGSATGVPGSAAAQVFDATTSPTPANLASEIASATQPIAGFNSMSAAQQIQAADPELTTYLSDAQNQMSASGFSQFSQIVDQDWSGAQYPDDYGLLQAAIGTFQQNGGSSADVSVANNLVNSDIQNDNAVYTNTLAMNQALANLAETSPETSAPGQFSTQGDQIIGPDGKPFLSVGGMTDQTQNYDPTTMLQNGANTVRMFIPHDPSQMQEFENAVQQVTAAGDVAVITGTVDPDGHQTGQTLSGTELQGFENMWTILANQYKNNPNVWFETLNESGNSQSSNNAAWLNEQEGMINAIRATGSNNMIMVDDSNWGQGATSGGFSALTADAQQLEQTSDNIVGSVHVYIGGSEQQDETTVASAIQNIENQGLPAMVGETGDWLGGEPGMLASMAAGEQDGFGRIEMISGDLGNNTYVSNFITDQSAIPDLRSAVLNDWQVGEQQNAALQNS